MLRIEVVMMLTGFITRLAIPYDPAAAAPAKKRTNTVSSKPNDSTIFDSQ